MAKKKVSTKQLRGKSSKQFSFRCTQLLLNVLNELVLSTDAILGNGRKCHSRTTWIEAILFMFCKSVLGNKISPKQIQSCNEPPDVFRLFVMWSRARQGAEGYGFTTKSKKTRFVYGPKVDTEIVKMSDYL